MTTAIICTAILAALLLVLGLIPGWTLAIWLVAFMAIPAYVLVGLRAARAPASTKRRASSTSFAYPAWCSFVQP